MKAAIAKQRIKAKECGTTHRDSIETGHADGKPIQWYRCQHCSRTVTIDGTLLQGLCHANGTQGGTIHQYMHGQDFAAMQTAYAEYISCGFTFPQPEAFDKLANEYHITIDWRS